jgi:glycosyltransferase involved in cell wall biosynthesis
MLGGKDLGVVPSIWWDNGPQTVFELLACGVPVLGADLGGIPDAVRHEENGLLFRGNDRYDLARQIVRAVREPGLVERLRSGVRPPKSMDEHGEEIEVLLKDVIASRVPVQAVAHAGKRDA